MDRHFDVSRELGRRGTLATFLLVVVAATLASCQLTRPSPAPQTQTLEVSNWMGLQFNVETWELTEVEDSSYLAHKSVAGCEISYILGGSDLPPEWTVEKGFETLGSNSFKTFRVGTGSQLRYVNYFYDTGDPGLNLGGFQVRSQTTIDECIRSAEDLLRTLDPSGLVIPTGAPLPGA